MTTIHRHNQDDFPVPAQPLSWIDKLHEEHGIPACGPIAVGDGWRQLVESAYSLLAPCQTVAQVKEKFGILCVYVDHDISCESYKAHWQKWNSFERVLGEVSSRTCEQCGAYGFPRTGGWIKTMCDKCAESSGERNDD